MVEINLMPPPSATSKPLISDRPTAFGLIFPNNCLHWAGMNWCGTTKIRMSASLAASTKSGTATYKHKSFTPNSYAKTVSDSSWWHNRVTITFTRSFCGLKIQIYSTSVVGQIFDWPWAVHTQETLFGVIRTCHIEVVGSVMSLLFCSVSFFKPRAYDRTIRIANFPFADAVVLFCLEFGTPNSLSAIDKTSRLTFFCAVTNNLR